MIYNFIRRLIIIILLAARFQVASATTDPGEICITVGRMLENGHYSQRKLNDDFSRQFLDNYLLTLDGDHLLFTQSDVDSLTSKYGAALCDDVLLGNSAPAFDIFNLYQQRFEDRLEKIETLLKHNFTFKDNRFIEINRQKSDWAKNEEEADERCNSRLESEFLQEKLTDHPIDTPFNILKRRYNLYQSNLHKQTHEDILKIFLTTLALTFDPHSEYLSRSDLDNFNINISMSLVGIGAEMKTSGEAKIVNVIPGGPAHRDGRLKVGDRITAVAQGDSSYVNVVGLTANQIAEMIRGKKGTVVSLEIIPSHALDPSVREHIKLVRDEVKLKESEASAAIIESGSGSELKRIGWITLPIFYTEMDHAGLENPRSASKDVSKLLILLQQKKVDGVIFDLRGNSGGSLDEAIKLTGLFVPNECDPKPVVQIKDSNASITVSDAADIPCVYDGPLVILTNRVSASSSEIFASALQDYGRAIIVGDQRTFGKGTVQSIIKLGAFIPSLNKDSNEAGALKITTQKIYRLTGKSTQVVGVIPDIYLPSIYDRDSIGESALSNPIPYDEIKFIAFKKTERTTQLVEELKTRSAARVAHNTEFSNTTDDLKRIRTKIFENKVSLNEELRRAEIAEEKTFEAKKIAGKNNKITIPFQQVDQVTFDNSGNIVDLKIQNKDTEKIPLSPVIDEALKLDYPICFESLNVISDLIELSHDKKRLKAGE